jgi:hypothetical protein
MCGCSTAPTFRHSTRYPDISGSGCVDLNEGLANQRVPNDHRAAETALLLEFNGRCQEHPVKIAQPFYKSTAELSLRNRVVEDRLGSRTEWIVQPPLR